MEKVSNEGLPTYSWSAPPPELPSLLLNSIRKKLDSIACRNHFNTLLAVRTLNTLSILFWYYLGVYWPRSQDWRKINSILFCLDTLSLWRLNKSRLKKASLRVVSLWKTDWTVNPSLLSLNQYYYLIDQLKNRKDSFSSLSPLTNYLTDSFSFSDRPLCMVGSVN